ncbi:PR domain zinc finger protein 5-like [Bombyx mandarina]|uniref:PR domain zinc finger protein 5-like n=1 Tax=Bombyx mandarina TaxID=7092 RepID=A0A6J2K638_BOMMA|nr:PR domain zinc finger protein 5-like [Bombyx mandarina]
MHETDLEDSTNSILWLHEKLKCLWNCTKFCGMCLETENLNAINLELVISRQKESKSLLDIINFIFRDDVANIMSCSYICDKCTEKTLQSYIFISNTKKLSKVINTCVNDLHSKVTDINEQVLSTLECNKSNIVIVLEEDDDTLEDIKELTTVSEIVPTQNPVLKKLPQTNISSSKSTVVIVEDDDVLNRINTNKHITAKGGEIVINPIKLNIAPSVPQYVIYKCSKCTAIFTTYKSLKEHEKVKHSSKLFKCTVCSKVYLTLQSLDLHYKTHEVARCRYCLKITKDNELMLHLKKEHGTMLSCCLHCDNVYYTHEALQTHIRVSHSVNNTTENPQCQYCYLEFTTSNKSLHKCKFNCPECTIMPCIHHEYLISYRNQILSHASKAKCLNCDYTTSRKEYLVTHANREHLDHHPFTCSECNMQFYTKASLRIHIDQYHIENTCEYCDKEYNRPFFLQKHRNQCKTIIRKIKCDQCVASFDNVVDYDKHVFLKHNNGGYKCTLCNKRFMEEIELQQHEAMIHSSTVQYKKRSKHIECTLCEIKFKSIKMLQQHQDTIHKAGTLFPCKSCPKKFYSLKKLQLHQHRHYERIQCEKCRRKIISAFYLKHVIKCSSEWNMKKHICEMCGKALLSETALNNHIKTHQIVTCPVCNKRLKESLLEKHMTRHKKNVETTGYSNIKAIPMRACPVCGHLVRKKLDLEAHMNRYHYKIKPFKCQQCSKEFCGRARLREHQLTHEEKSCICNICHKKMANRVCLKMHLRIHTGECPYTCEHCGEKFRSSSILSTHIQKKHAEKTVSCPSCDSMFHFVREMRHHFKHVHWKGKDRPFDYKEVVPKMYHHLFEDGRLPKLDDNET